MMTQEVGELRDAFALERAAKYICTAKYGLCPMVVEKVACYRECTLEVEAWQCWQTFFLSQRPKNNSNAAGAR